MNHARAAALSLLALASCAAPRPGPAEPPAITRAPRCTPPDRRAALDAFVAQRRPTYTAALGKARAFLDSLAVDPIALRTVRIKGKKKLTEALDAYYRLYLVAPPDGRAAILARVEELARPTREDRYLDLLLGDGKNLLILLAQAPIIAYLMTLATRSDAIVGPKANSYDAKTVLFMLSTVAVWFGVINAAREIAKESAVYRRERLAGLGVGAYVLSKVLVLSLLVAAQSAVTVAVLGNDVRFPAMGVMMDGFTELFITTALTSLAGLSLGLAISAWARTPDRAISVVPLALIPQILFSGVLFPFDRGISTTRVLSWGTVSRWAMDAYATTIHLAKLPPPSRGTTPEWAYTRDNLVLRWEILGGYTIACLAIACVVLWARDEDA